MNHVGCCRYEHKRSIDWEGFGASAKEQNQTSTWVHSVRFFVPQHAHSTPGKASDDAQLTTRSRGHRDGEKGSDETSSCKQFQDLVVACKRANGQSPDVCDYIRQLPSTCLDKVLLRLAGRVRSLPSSIALSTLGCSRYVGLQGKGI